MRKLNPHQTCRAFTLVELLVVIGIIALLISILLPALNNARKSANQTKCMAALKEIGNAFQYYALEYQGYYPPAQLQPATGQTYEVNGDIFPVPGDSSAFGAYWYNFLQKYVSKSKIGMTDASGQDTATARNNKSIFWGCTAFEGYSNTAGAFNKVQPGYGMNAFPTFTSTYPAATAGGPFGGSGSPATYPPEAQRSYVFTSSTGGGWAPTSTNKSKGFVKQRIYAKNGATRLLVADSKLWLAQSAPVVLPLTTMKGDVNENLAAQNDTYISIWRHGKFPPPQGAGFPATKGKIAYNILYADGHVAQVNDVTEAFRSIRMRYPG